ncbi:MAG: hypothetical protein ACQESK_06430 [Bacteroidota bacterium]
MKKIYFLFLIFIFQSCDYYGDYNYNVKNKLADKNIQVKIFVDRNVERDSFNITPFSEKKVFTHGSGNLGRNEDPSDIFTDQMTDFDSIFVYKDGVLIDLDFLDRSYWEFEMSGNNTNTYTLKITEELVEE